MLDIESEAHEIWAMAQLMPDEGIVDGVDRIKNKLAELTQHTKHAEALRKIAADLDRAAIAAHEEDAPNAAEFLETKARQLRTLM